MGFKENLKSELAYSGMLVKELAAKSGVNKNSINNYLNARGQIPSVEVGQKIAQALGVSVEYLVTGQESDKTGKIQKSSNDVRIIARLAEQLDGKKRKFIIDFIKWLKKANYVMLILK
jgi:transcriptional regulator with XRE-family HTH domain